MLKNKEVVFDILKYPRLAELAPLRIIVKKDEDGKYLGYCENSFSMSWETNRVNVCWSGVAYSNLGTTHTLDATNTKGPAGVNCEILDPLSEDCPIRIDWERWLNATGKYDQRNASFKVREETAHA